MYYILVSNYEFGRLNILKRLYKFLYSVKVTLYTLFVLCVTSIVGSITVKSNLIAPPEHMSFLEKFFKTYDLFHSWWFIMLGSFFVVNLTLCIIHHFIPHVKIYFSKELFNEKLVKSPWISGKVKAAALSLDDVKRFFKSKGYKIHETVKGIVCEKGRYSRLLPILFHISLLVIIIGALIGALYGFVGTVNVHVKSETDQFFNWTELKNDKFDFTMRVDDFILEYYPTKVTIAVRDKRELGKVQVHEVYEKNTFSIEGTSYKIELLDAYLDKRYTKSNFFFRVYEGDKELGDLYDDQEQPEFPYQLYYPVQFRIGVRPKSAHTEDLYRYQVTDGEAFTIPSSPFTVLVNGFAVDERIDTPVFNFTLYNNGMELGNYFSNEEVPGFDYAFVLNAIKFPEPAKRIPRIMKARLSIVKDGAVKAEGDVEVNHPLSYENLRFYETSYDRDQFGFMYIGFQIVSDPGVDTVYAGFLIMFLAVSFVFFVSHKKIYITLDEDYIILTGEATKDKAGFKEDFFNYINELKKNED